MAQDRDLKSWFVNEVLPLEPVLLRFLKRHCTDQEEVQDVRQEVYERLLSLEGFSHISCVRSFMIAAARNALIDRARRAKVVAFEHFTDGEFASWESDEPSLERALTARDELRLALAGLDRLPPKCREVVRLRKVEGLSIKETAIRLGVTHHTVERQLTLGIRALADFMLGGDGRLARKSGPAVLRSRIRH